MRWLSDNPIISHHEDKLNFDNSATVLKNLIIKSDTPISIGINGKWGSGKTSLMQLVREKLEKYDESKIIIGWFDTWNYSNEREIWRVLMISLLDDLDPKNKNSVDIINLISSILNLGLITSKAWLSQGATLYSDQESILEKIKNISKIRKSREETIVRNQIKTVKAFRENFEKIVEKSVEGNGKFVVFIDDLDRIMPDKILDIIEAIKTFLSCKRCVFVIGCDYDYLNTCIENRYKGLNLSGRDYMEKIVQIPFNVPSMEGPQYINFVWEFLGTSFIHKEEFELASDLIARSIGKNPRKIKRLVNFNYIIENLNINNELYPMLLFKLLCFMSKWPNSYRKFVEAYYMGENKFRKYEKWALPTQKFEEYTGIDFERDEFETGEPDEPNPNEEYKRYLENDTRIKKEVNQEIQEKEKDSDEELLRKFLSTRPFLSGENNLNLYIALLETIDINAIVTNRNLDAMPSTTIESKFIKTVINCFDGQKVDGKYFLVSKEVILPKKKSIEKNKILKNVLETNEIGEWAYQIVKYRHELNVNTIDHLLSKHRKSQIFWIISPWKFPRTMIELAKNKGNIYLTDIFLLRELSNELQKT